MSPSFTNFISVLMSIFTSILSFFGINLYNNGFDDIDFSAVKDISFSSELVLEDLHYGSQTILQGGCTDGKYAYFCSHNGYADVCSISKYEIDTWKEVARSNVVDVDHGNDITYNKDKRCLVVCHNAPNRTLVSYVDKDTLEIIETIEIPLEIYSITYNAKTNKYAVGISYTFDFAILDKNFKVIETIKGVKPKSTTRQGMDSDDKYLYFLLSFPNAISVYDWDGNHYGVFELNDEAAKYESENIFLLNDDLYIGYNYSFGKVYKTSFEVTY
ncbi:MAG: hypothetical protein E7555_00575 [Ruminococcaceae bacterium]|nr:hypothetical protein [Oscillospiraceae bacterium]